MPDSSPEPSTPEHRASASPAAEEPTTTSPSDPTSPKPESSASPLPQATPAVTPTPAVPAAPVGAYAAGDWQAIWSPPHNAYYFYNSKTQETTWKNPVQPGVTPAASSSISTASGSGTPGEAPTPGTAAWDIYQMQAAAVAQGIDPSLAHLDPSLAAGPSNIPGGAFTAKFNARTGAFAKPDARDPTHLSEFERAKRMSEFYFDVGAWEKELEKRNTEEYQEEEEKKRKRKPSKKDLDRFKEQKRLKKIAKTAWLRT